MLYVVIGASKSGKSRYAEQLALKLRKERMLYLATMIPEGDGEAGTACVNRHREQRKGLGFLTVEKPLRLGHINFQKDDVALLEDVHNLIGNYLFVDKNKDALSDALGDIREISSNCKDIIAVSYSTLPIEESFDDETKHYIRQLNEAVDQLCERADGVILLVDGVPHVIKGTVPE